MGRDTALRIYVAINAWYGYLYCSIWWLGNAGIVLGTESELKWRFKPYGILANEITSKWFLLVFFHSKYIQHSEDVFLSVWIWKYRLSTTQDRKVFVENKNRPEWSQPSHHDPKESLIYGFGSAVGQRPQPIGNLQNCGRRERLWSTALGEFQGLLCFWPNPNVNSLLGPYLLTLAGLRNQVWILNGVSTI